ncbi:MAG: ERCC4 domain-containing protein [Candidatus Wallbacteria bacterium]|nr:ERCC4 domain-containing protein [Candidatus Wallbacteria bacterium]
MTSCPFTPVIDTREQCPLALPGAVRGTLRAGDYSLLGFERFIAIERKSLSDLYGTLGGGRERFTLELERLRAVPFRALVIEGALSDILHSPPEHSAIHPSAIVGSLAAWAWRYGLPVWFAGNAADAAVLVERLLRLAHRELLEPWEWRTQREAAARHQRERRAVVGSRQEATSA